MKFILLAIALLVPSIASAGSSALSESNFLVEASPNSVTTEKLRITNMATIEQRYEISLSENNFDENISIAPSTFRLNPNMSQEVVLRFRQPEESSRTSLALLAFDANQASALKVGNGIHVPVEFKASQIAGASIAGSKSGSASVWNVLIYIIDAMLVILISWIIYNHRTRPSHCGGYKINFV